jgi:hypothetical protein
MCLTGFIRRPGKSLLRITIAAVVMTAATLGFSESSRPEAAPLASGVVASVDGTYDVRPDEGVAHAEWKAMISNTGPSPWLSESDPRNHPTEIEIFVPAGFTDFQVRGPGGGQYPVVFEDVGGGSIARAQLGYAMPYGDIVNLDYSFTLKSDSDSGTLIRPTYVYLDASDGLWPDSYDTAVVRITLPTNYARNASVTYAVCEPTTSGESTTLTCLGDEAYGAYADLEVIDEDSRLAITKEIEINGRDVDLVLRYWRGDEAWAEHAEELITDALPIFAEMFGAAYAGPSTIRLSEKGGSELYGNRGLALCQNTICALAATPAGDDQVILHEISHMWSNPFDNKWLAEGIAEYVSLKAAAMLGIPGFEEWADPAKAPEATSRHRNQPNEIVTAEAPSFALDPWGGRFGFSPDDIFIDPRAGYSWGARFWQEIEIEHGPEPFAKVMGDIQWKVPDGTIDSEAIMDRLEDAGGVKADALFKSYVFSADQHLILDQRRDTRDALEELRAAARETAPELDTAVFAPIQEAILDWRFDDSTASVKGLRSSLDEYTSIRGELQPLRTEAEAADLTYPFPWEEGTRTWEVNTAIVDDLDAAYEAVDAYRVALADFEKPRSFLQRVGLIGKNDRAELDEAAGHFAWARFDESMEHSRLSQEMIAGAGDVGRTYLIVLGILVTAMVSFITIVYVVSRQPRPSTATGTQAGG